MLKLKRMKILCIVLCFFMINASFPIHPAFARTHCGQGITCDGDSFGEETQQGEETSPEGAQSAPGETLMCGDPIAVANGEFICEAKVDLEIPSRGMPITIKRIYRSQREFNGQFGYGWFFNFYKRLKKIQDGDIVLVDGETGEQRTFTYDSQTDTFEAPWGYFAILEENTNGSYTLTKKGGLVYNFSSTGLIQSIVDRNGNQISYSYTATPMTTLGIARYPVTLTDIPVVYDYRLTTITDPLGRQISLTYNSDGRLSKITDFASREIEYSYDTNGNLTSVEDPLDNVVEYAYYSDHNMHTITDAKDQTYMTNTYDDEDRVVSQVHGTGTYTFSYDSENNATTFTDKEGNVTKFWFNSDEKLIRTRQYTDGLRSGEPEYYETNYEYDNYHQLVEITKPDGNGVTYTYGSGSGGDFILSDLSHITLKDDMDSQTVEYILHRFTYESQFDLIKTYRDPEDNITTFTYDYELDTSDPDYGEDGNLVKIEYPQVGGQTPTVELSYNQYGQVAEVTDPNGNVTEYTYSSTNGQLTSIVQDPDGLDLETTITYDSYGYPDTITDPLDNETDLDFNALKQLTQITDALDYVTKYTYDANGNVTKIEKQKDASATQWQTTNLTYTTLNKVATIVNPLSKTTTYTYNDNDQLETITDANSKVTTYQYDERGKLFKILDAQATPGVTQYDYDLNGNLAKITDAEGNETIYSYDGFDRVISETYADSSSRSFEYDDNSNLTELTTPDNTTVEFTYDVLNRLTAKAFPNNTSLNTSFTYDLGSRLLTANNSASNITFTYDDANRMLTETQQVNSTNYTMTYTYDAGGNVSRLVYPSTKQMDYTYTALNEMAAISVNSSSFLNYTYDVLRRRTGRSFINNNLPSTAYVYDDANQLSSITNSIIGGSQISQYSYSYNDSGYRTQMVNGANTYNYGYNNIYELTSVSNAQTHSYAYDKVGNRTTVDSVNYTDNNLNQYTQVNSVNFSYDNNGNLTSDGNNTYTYDRVNRLATASSGGNSASYTYDAFNRRVSKTVNSTTTYYVYDGADVAAEYSSAGVLQAEYVLGANVDEVLAMDRNSTRYYYSYDGLGSVTDITNSSGTTLESYTYGPYGIITSSLSSIGNPYYFTGRRYDTETGLYYYRARAYDPSIGRFLQRDPLGYYDSMNLYSYVTNDPVNWVDPWGLWTIQIGISGTIGLKGGGTWGGGIIFGGNKKDGFKVGTYGMFGGGAHVGGSASGTIDFSISRNDSICDLEGTSASSGGSIQAILPWLSLGAESSNVSLDESDASLAAATFSIGVGVGTPEGHIYIVNTIM